VLYVATTSILITLSCPCVFQPSFTRSKLIHADHCGHSPQEPNWIPETTPFLVVSMDAICTIIHSPLSTLRAVHSPSDCMDTLVGGICAFSLPCSSADPVLVSCILHKLFKVLIGRKCSIAGMVRSFSSWMYSTCT